LGLVQAIDELKARWRAQLLARSDSSAWNTLSLIPRHLVLDSRVVAAELGISPRAALSALEALRESGILEEHSRPIGKGRPSRLFVSSELLALVDVF
jgi:predicted ArsR family transcriptional regulator